VTRTYLTSGHREGLHHAGPCGRPASNRRGRSRAGGWAPMSVMLRVRCERWPIAGAFTISRGSKTEAEVVVAELTDGPFYRARRMHALSAFTARQCRCCGRHRGPR